MASRTWTGAVSTSWATAGNWSPATVPVNGDDVFIPETATNDLTTNVDRTGDNAGAGINLNTLRIQKDSTVAVGTAAGPLKITCNELIHLGRETLYYDSNSSDVTDLVEIRSNNLGSAAVLGGTKDYTRMMVHRGGVSYAGTGASTDLWLGSELFDGDARVTIAGTSSPLSDLYLIGGTITTASAVTSCVAFRGRLTITGTVALGTLLQFGADIFYETTGTLTTGFFCVGKLDATGAGVPITMGTIFKYPPHRFEYSSALTTFTSFTDYGDQT